MAKRNRLRRSSRGSKGGFTRKLLLLLSVTVIVVLGTAAFILFETENPTLVLEKEIRFLGTNVELPFRVSDTKSGINSVVIAIEQNGTTTQLFNRVFQRQAWLKKAGPPSANETVTIDAKKANVQDGQATLIISVRDFSLNGMLKGNETVKRLPVNIDTKPPRVSVSHAQRYIRPGGSGIVTYTVSEPAQRHGVVIDDFFYQGYPLGSKGKNFIAYIALPWNAPAPETTKVIAVDEAGNEGKGVFSTIYKKTKFKSDKINVSKGFLKRKIPEFEEHYPEMTGTMIEKYLYANNSLRQSNAQSIKDACAHPIEQQLWYDKFIRMPGSNKAGYADQRTYFHQGRPIDNQTHLGIDIASTARVAIKAANKGKVIYADFLGIYGNMIILDHGQGVFSLYSHLSRIDTTVDTLVDKDAVIGHSGATGMAGGDHLHFSMLIHGIFVTPIEWWDQHWIEVNINDIIGDAQL